jgi:hypothetical protein
MLERAHNLLEPEMHAANVGEQNGYIPSNFWLQLPGHLEFVPNEWLVLKQNSLFWTNFMSVLFALNK